LSQGAIENPNRELWLKRQEVMTIALPALVLAGLLTFLSPCVLPLVPIYLAMLAGTSAVALRGGSGQGKRLVAATLLFALGLSLAFVTLGLAASAVGRALSAHRALAMQLAGLAVFLAGLKLMGLVQIPWLDREARPWLASLQRGSGYAWPFLFGAAFALGWSPCVGPLLGSVLALAASTGSPAKAASYLGLYALGLTLPLVVLSFAAPLALRLLDRAKRFLRAFEVSAGALLAVMGLLFVTGHATALLPSLEPAAATVAPRAEVPTAAPAACNTIPLAPPPATENAMPSSPVEGVPTMLEFVAEGCPVCQRMAPVVAAAEQDCSRHGVRIERIDVSTRQGRDLAGRHGILGVPTFLFLEREGSEVARLVGEQPPQVLIQSLEVLAGQKCDGFRPLPAAPSPGS
jgi:cytochrome c-type biogenesis protein